MEKTLKLTTQEAKELLGKDKKLDILIRASFTKEELELSIMDKIKTFKDACEYLEIDMEAFYLKTVNDTKDEKAYKKLKIITQALNEGVVMNYNDVKEYKYYPWFYAAGSGSGFSYCGCSFDGTASFVGARLCYKTKELAFYAGKQFLDIYNDYING